MELNQEASASLDPKTVELYRQKVLQYERLFDSDEDSPSKAQSSKQPNDQQPRFQHQVTASSHLPNSAAQAESQSFRPDGQSALPQRDQMQHQRTQRQHQTYQEYQRNYQKPRDQQESSNQQFQSREINRQTQFGPQRQQNYQANESRQENYDRRLDNEKRYSDRYEPPRDQIQSNQQSYSNSSREFSRGGRQNSDQSERVQERHQNERFNQRGRPSEDIRNEAAGQQTSGRYERAQNSRQNNDNNRAGNQRGDLQYNQDRGMRSAVDQDQVNYRQQNSSQRERELERDRRGYDKREKESPQAQSPSPPKRERRNSKERQKHFTPQKNYSRQQLQGNSKGNYQNDSSLEGDLDPQKDKFQGADKKTPSSFSRIIRHHQKHSFEREDLDYIKSICKRALNLRQIRDQQDKEDKRQQRKQEEQKSQLQVYSVLSLSSTASFPAQNSKPLTGANQTLAQVSGSTAKTIEQRIFEAKKIAEYFYLLNETNWNKFDDVFFVINRRWFDRWKDFISYDYIVKFLVELGKKESDLSINKILASNSSPGEISNAILLLDKKDYLQLRVGESGGSSSSSSNERSQQYLNSPLKPGILIERDIFLVSESIWRFLQARYKGDEIKRFAIYRNSVGLIDRSPYLPLVQVCLILRDEAIRYPKGLVLPRKSQFLQVKWQIKEVFSWLREYLDDEIRLWRLKPEFKDLDFIEQFNQSLVNKTLPKRMIFPGFSLEKSLSFYIEEYATFDRQRETLFIEIRKIKSLWLFDLDYKDQSQFDEGAFNTQSHLVLYSGGMVHQENWQTDYSVYYKYHNNSLREYFDTGYTLEDLYKAVKLQLPWRPSDNQNQNATKKGKKQGKQSKQKQANPELLTQQEQECHISEISSEDDQKMRVKKSSTHSKDSKYAGVVQSNKNESKSEMKKCGNCSKPDLINKMTKCQECQSVFYCSEQCKERDKRFHQTDCERYRSDPQASQQALQSSSITVPSHIDTLNNPARTEVIQEPSDQRLSQIGQEKHPQSQESTFKIVSDDSDDSSSDSVLSSKDAVGKDDSFNSYQSPSHVSILQVQYNQQQLPAKIGNRREAKAAAKLRKKKEKDQEEQDLQRCESDMILNFDTNEEFKQMAHQAQHQTRKRSDVSSICSEFVPLIIDNGSNKRRKLDTKTIQSHDSGAIALESSSSIVKAEIVLKQEPLSGQMTKIQGIGSALETPFKFETIRDKPFLKPRLVATLPGSESKYSKLAAISILFSQLPELREHLSLEQGPINAIMLNVLNDLLFQQPLSNNAIQVTQQTYNLPVDKLQRLLDCEQPLQFMFRQLIQKLSQQSQQIQTMFSQKLKFIQTCLNCNQKHQAEREEQFLELSNQTDEQLSRQSVKLKILYIFEYDQVKKYEISLKPGEYTFAEVMQKIKEKVQVDRQGVRMCKKVFILVDLIFESTMFGQMFSNEQMKFNFKEGQSLTTFAYEITRNHKEKIKKYSFVHVARADQLGQITYHSFPRLIFYKEADLLRNIAFKILKGLKTTVLSSSPCDEAFALMNENDSFNYAFGRGLSNEIYEMVLVLKDGSRWKLDPHEKKKLNQIVDMEQIVRFEAIFPTAANFDSAKALLQRELHNSPVSEPIKGLKDIHQCLRKYLRQCIVGGDIMGEPCKDCKEAKGAQQSTELMKLGSVLGVVLTKVEKTQKIEIPVRVQLDKYMSKNSGYYQQGNDYELVGAIGTITPQSSFLGNSSTNSIQTQDQNHPQALGVKIKTENEAKSESDPKLQTDERPKIKQEDTEESKNDGQLQKPAEVVPMKFALLYNSRERVAYRYTFGEDPKVETVPITAMDELGEAIMNESELEFVLYKKVKRDSHSFSRS